MIRDQLHIDEQGVGWRIVSALTFEDAERAIAQAKVSGSVAHTDTENGVTLAEVKRDEPRCTCTPAIGMRHSPYCPIFAYEVANDERAGRLPPRHKRADPTKPELLPANMLATMIPGRLLGIDLETRDTATAQAQLETYCKGVEVLMPPLRKIRGRLVFPGLPPFEMPTFDTDCKVSEVEHDKPRRFMSLSVEMKLTDESRRSLRRFARQLMGHERPPLVDVLPSWETDEFGDDREVWNGAMRIVRNRKRMRKLKRRGVLFMDLRAKQGNKHPDGYEGPRAWAWFTQDLHSEAARRDLLESITDDMFDDVPAGTSEEE